MKPKQEELKYYKEVFADMFEYMKKYFNVGNIKPPKVILNYKDQDDTMYIQTGYYDPETKTVVIFMANRHRKDIGRSFFHECFHYLQDLNGTLKKSRYGGDKITEDENLTLLEGETYLKGNLAFRSYTETKQKENRN